MRLAMAAVPASHIDRLRELLAQYDEAVSGGAGSAHQLRARILGVADAIVRDARANETSYGTGFPPQQLPDGSLGTVVARRPVPPVLGSSTNRRTRPSGPGSVLAESATNRPASMWATEASPGNTWPLRGEEPR